MQSGILGLGSNKWALLILPSKGVGSYGLALEGMDLMKLGEKKFLRISTQPFMKFCILKVDDKTFIYEIKKCINGFGDRSPCNGF